MKITHGKVLKIIKIQKMKYFGHITRRNTLEKLVLQGKIKGARRKRDQGRRKWTDDIEECVQTKNRARWLMKDFKPSIS